MLHLSFFTQGCECYECNRDYTCYYIANGIGVQTCEFDFGNLTECSYTSND